MRYPDRLSSIELLQPRTDADRRALYDLILDALRPSGTPAEPARLIALAAVRHLSGWGGRILLSGENTQTKITIVRTLAQALELPFVEIDVGSLAETNWKGSDLSFYLERLYAQLEQRYPRASVPRIVERACVLLTHLERVRVPGAYTGSSSTRDYREGKALSLCPLAGDGVIPVSKDGGGGFLWPSKKALVIATAQFDGMTSPVPDAEAMELWGIARPLADALAGFTWIEVGSLDTSAVGAALRTELQAVVDKFLAFGFHLRVHDQVLRYLVELITSGTRAGDVASVAAIVAASADRALIRLLDEQVGPGAVYVMARDDLDRSIGVPSAGPWRE